MPKSCQVDTGPIYGFYGNPDNPKEIFESVVLGRDMKGMVIRDSSPGAAQVTLQTSKVQDQAISKFFKNLEKSPGKYNLYSRNCSTTAAEALRSAGIPAGGGKVPFIFFGGAKIRNNLLP